MTQKINIENEKIIQELIKLKNLRPNTIKNYHTCIDLYTTLLQKNMSELIKEAINEEENNISWRNRKLRKHLIQYKEYLNQHYRKGTIKKYYTTICAVYRTYEIEINKIPVRTNNKSEVITYEDIPTKEELKKALEYMPLKMKSLTLLIISSGLTIVDVLNLTIQDFIEATKDYHSNYKTIKEQLTELNNNQEIVATWKLRRQKTNKHFYTFTTPEANNTILQYLKTRHDLKPEDKLFDLSTKTIYQTYKQINKNLEMGHAGPGYNRLRPHMLRKYHASHLKDAIGMDYVDELQGRGKTEIRESYFYENPTKLRQIYIENMQNVTIHNEKYENKTLTEENNMLRDKSEYLEKENREIKENIRKEAQKAVEEILKEIK